MRRRKEMGKKFYTADLHLGDTRICNERIERGNAPFAFVDEMNDYLIRQINLNCSKQDTLYILGDVCPTDFNPVPLLKRIKPKLVLVRGNHDWGLMQHKSSVECFKTIEEHMMFTDGKWDLFLNHYPIAEWDGYFKGRILFYGHVHAAKQAGALLMDYLPTAINVGVDVNGYVPKTADELIYERRKTYEFPKSALDMEKILFPQMDNRAAKRLDMVDYLWGVK